MLKLGMEWNEMECGKALFCESGECHKSVSISIGKWNSWGMPYKYGVDHKRYVYFLVYFFSSLFS